MTIIQAENLGFDDALIGLGTLAGANPIFTPTFQAYYLKAAASGATNQSCISVIQNDPVVGLLVTETLVNGNKRLDYYGQPATFIVNENSVHLETGLWELSEFVLGRGLRSEISNEGVGFEVTMPQGVLAHKTKLLDLMLRESISLSPYVVGKRELISSQCGETEDISIWSRSTRSSLKKARELGLTCRVFDEHSDRRDLEEAFWSFRDNHLSAAGRETRPVDSWREQLKLILEGNSFLCVAELSGVGIGGAYFMHGFGSVYYAVAANEPKYKHVPIAPLLLVNAIEHSIKIGAKKFWLGPQLSNKSAEVSKKLASIEKFKSSFVDSFDLNLTAAR